MSPEQFLGFPDGFAWGAASSAYQIEGAWNEDGRGLSIWDTFSHTRGRVERSENGDIACDFYHRWQQDLNLASELNLNAFRFSISWPRIFPSGTGQINPAGLDFYDRLVDGLLACGIEPYLTLYHWDLPQALQDKGGWAQRNTVAAFGEYAEVVGKRLGDRVRYWITHNEPAVVSLIGNVLGHHAPGFRNPLTAAKVWKHLLVSHGLAVQTLRSVLRPDAQIGITLNLSPVHPASDSDADRNAADRLDLISNRMFLDPVLLGCLPQAARQMLGVFYPRVSQADLELMSQPIDFLGVNYYSRLVVKANRLMPVIRATQIHPPGNEYSQMWEIYPLGLHEILTRVWLDYLQTHHPGMPILITENGVCVPDGVDFDLRVRDERRIRYLEQHLQQVWQVVQDGVPVTGYFTWALMDNFEWALGYRTRFGLIYVDFERQKRIIKDSGRWFSQVIRQNGLTASLPKL
jgi:beta-glucosidase